MTQLVEGGRPIARFRLLGFPVHIDISFVIIIAVLGWYPGVTAKAFVVWLVMVPIAVLTHELGHAFVARSTGAEPSIALAGLGGLTTYVPPRPLSRARSFAISVAGPAVGLVIGGALHRVRPGRRRTGRSGHDDRQHGDLHHARVEPAQPAPRPAAGRRAGTARAAARRPGNP